GQILESGEPTDLGVIGDTIWFDQNGNGVHDEGEPGIEGVVVELLDGDGNVINRTVTDENGHYSFGGLPVGPDYPYQVRVADENFADGGVLKDFYNTAYPDGGVPNAGGSITLDEGNRVNL